MSLQLPSGPGQMVAFDLLEPLPKTEEGNKYAMLVVDLFSKHAEGYALTKGEKTAEGCASKLVNDYIRRRGCPYTKYVFIGKRYGIYTNGMWGCF